MKWSKTFLWKFHVFSEPQKSIKRVVKSKDLMVAHMDLEYLIPWIQNMYFSPFQ